MLVYFRHIYREVYLIFDFILAICSQAHQISTTALALQHIADSLFIEFALSQYANDQCSLLNQANSSVLQFASSVCFGVDVADFFQLQTSLQADGIVDATAHKEHIVCIRILCCKPLDALFIFQNFLHLLRDGQQLGDIIAVLFLSDFFSDLGKLNCQTVHRCQLCAVCLCCSNRDFRAGKSVEHLIRFASNAAADHIDNSQCCDFLFFCKAKSCQCICRFP